MMKTAVMISVKPKWCELIASGRKTVEVRKTCPKLDAPFKCYIYCTNGKNEALWRYRGEYYYDRQFPNERPDRANGKVIGEFTCDRIFPYCQAKPVGNAVEVERQSCLTCKEVWEYAPSGNPVGWHISDLVIYDKPKELSEFWKPCPYGEDSSCFVCEKSGYTPDMHIDCFNTITRPPQSWCYVEELEETDGDDNG